MALVLDVTIGGDTSNSYGTIAELAEYFTGRADAAAFLAASEQDRIARLIQATRINDLMIKAFGELVTETQSLEFPRENLVDAHGRSYTNSEIPSKVKWAQFEQALYLYSNNTKVPSMLMQGFSQARIEGAMFVTLDKTMLPKKLDTDAIDYLAEFGIVDTGSIGGTRSVYTIRY